MPGRIDLSSDKIWELGKKESNAPVPVGSRQLLVPILEQAFKEGLLELGRVSKFPPAYVLLEVLEGHSGESGHEVVSNML